MLKSVEEIRADLVLKKKGKEFYKYAILLVQTYEESYIIQERTRVVNDIKKLKACLHKTDYYGMNAMLKTAIRPLTKKLKMFKYLIK